jgi:ABC-type dipeptide/oligopeptide/nickel transport system ATPase component
VETLFSDPVHPYTKRLIGSILRPDLPTLPDLSRGAEQPPVLVSAGGVPYQAVSVEQWKTQGVGQPEMLEVAPGHLVLAHAVGNVQEAVA